MKPPQPDEDEETYRLRLKLESLQEATALLDQGALSNLVPFTKEQERAYFAQLAALMDAVAQRLDHEGVTWADIAYQGEAAVEKELFSDPAELLSYVLTEAVNPHYISARKALHRQMGMRHVQVIRERPEPILTADDDVEPPY